MLTRNMARISDLTKNLLAFSRGEERTYHEVQPAQVILEVVQLYRESASQHGITLVAELDESVRAAMMDAEGLHTCLTNLISNALDACLMSDSSSCTITVRLREEDDAIVVEVADTGCGMDYEVKKKVFTSFFTTKGRGGTGLGLLLTRKIVQQHGGSISLVSDVGEGTTFRLVFQRDRLPRSETKEAVDA
jgi:signal transduction histidine kinase